MKPATKVMPVAATVTALSTLACCTAAQLECGDWGSRSGGCDRAVPSLVCERVRLFPCRRSVPTLSLQANMSKKQPKRDRRLFNRCDLRFGSLIISAGDRRCSCGTISIDDYEAQNFHCRFQHRFSWFARVCVCLP